MERHIGYSAGSPDCTDEQLELTEIRPPAPPQPEEPRIVITVIHETRPKRVEMLRVLGPASGLSVCSSECDFVLPDLDVSRRHACIEFDGRGVFVEDLKSTNGTLVGGRRPILRRRRLGETEYVTVGWFQIHWQWENPPD